MSDSGSHCTPSASEHNCVEVNEEDLAIKASAHKRLASFMSTDPDLWIFRDFNRLNLFKLVYLQHHLADLERRLDQAVHDTTTGFNKAEYELLMPDIESSLQKYGT